MKKIIAYTLLFFSIISYAQPPLKYMTRFGGNGIDVGYDVKQTLDGHYIVTGSTSSFGYGNTDVLLTKVDSMGWVRWQKSFGGFNNDIGKAIILLPDSGFVIAGYTNSFGAGGYDIYVVRTDKNGTLIWQNTFGGIDWDFGNNLVRTPDGHFVVCGSTYSFGYGKNDGYVVKFSYDTGNLIWQKTFGGAEDDEFKSLLITYNNKIALAGTTKSMGDVKGDAWLFKLQLNGDSIFSMKYGDNKKQLINDISEHPVTHIFYLCGATDKVGRDTNSVYLLGLDEFGVFQFEDFHSYFKIKDEQYYALAHLKNNVFAYVRRCFYSGADLNIEPMVSVFDNNFFISATKYGSLSDDELFSVERTRDKGVICVGYTDGFSSNSRDVLLVKLDSTVAPLTYSVIGINEPQIYDKPNSVIFPVISNGQFNIQLNPSFKGSALIEVFNCLGQTVFNLEAKDPINAIDLSSYPDGTYIVYIRDGSLYERFKIVKIK